MPSFKGMVKMQISNLNCTSDPHMLVQIMGDWHIRRKKHQEDKAFETCVSGQAACHNIHHSSGQWFEEHFIFAVGSVGLFSAYKAFLKGTWRWRDRGKLPPAASASAFCGLNTGGKCSLPPDQVYIRIAGRQGKLLVCAPIKVSLESL